MKAESPALGPLGLGPLGLGPVGQVRIYLGSAHRFIWPVHLAGWLELGWTTEPGATPMAAPGGTPRVTSGVTSGAIGPGVTSAPRKKRVSSTPSPTNENPTGANPSGASTISATADEPLPVLVTDFLVDPSVPTND
jgi:hypothetical protein